MSLTGLDDRFEYLEVSEFDVKGIYNTFGKVCYSDGAWDGRNSTFQESFDRGFRDGFRMGFKTCELKEFFNDVTKNNKSENVNF